MRSKTYKINQLAGSIPAIFKPMTHLEKALHSARFLLEDIKPESLAEFTGIPLGVVVSALENINSANERDTSLILEIKSSVEKLISVTNIPRNAAMVRTQALCQVLEILDEIQNR